MYAEFSPTAHALLTPRFSTLISKFSFQAAIKLAENLDQYWKIRKLQFADD